MSVLLDWIFNNRAIWGMFAFCMVLILIIIGILVYKFWIRKNGIQRMFDDKIRNSVAMKECRTQIVNDTDAKLDDIRKSITEIKNSFSEQLREIRIDQLYSRILDLVHHTPEKVELIEITYKKYKDLGGNGYIDKVYKEWETKYAIGIIKDRLNEGGK